MTFMHAFKELITGSWKENKYKILEALRSVDRICFYVEGSKRQQTLFAVFSAYFLFVCGIAESLVSVILSPTPARETSPTIRSSSGGF